jgi:hypothetical protein
MSIHFKVGDFVRVRRGASYLQDFGLIRADDKLTKVKFIVEQVINDNRIFLRAEGYGDKNNYGNGVIFIDKKDLYLLEETKTKIKKKKVKVEKARIIRSKSSRS